MSLGSVIVLSGIIYASACRLGDVTELGIRKGRQVAWIYLGLGIGIDLLMSL